MSKSVPFPLPIIGVDVLSSETALTRGAVRSAVNVDIGRAGRFKRRVGYIRQVAASGMHSLFYAAQKGWTLVAQGVNLVRLDTDTYTPTFLMALNSPDELDYTEYNGNLYFANRSTLGWVPSGTTEARPVGVPVPPAPALSAALGALAPGRYGVVISFVDDRGEEGGASELQTVQLPDGGGIRLSNLPQQMGMTIYVYITSADGDILRFAAEFPAVFPSYVVPDTAQGAVANTQFLVPMPGGSFVRWHNGRLYTAEGSVLRFSEAMAPHLHDPAHGVVPFSGKISFIEPVADGIYVGDDRGVWFLAGADPAKFEQRRVSASTAVAHSSVLVPSGNFSPRQVQSDAPVAVWLSTSGYVAGLPGGAIVDLQADRIKVPGGLVGRTALLTRGGRKQLVTPINSHQHTTEVVAADFSIGP